MQTLYAYSGAAVQGPAYCDTPLIGCQGGACYAYPSGRHYAKQKGTHNMSTPASVAGMESTGKGVSAKHPPCGMSELTLRRI